MSDSARLATITTDTGAFAPGHRDFSRYDTPGLCLAAARWTHFVLQRTLEAQDSIESLRATPEWDTVGAHGTAVVARACGARFTVAGKDTESGGLKNVFRLAVWEQNDALAQAVVTRLIAEAPTAEQRVAVWQWALASYLTAEPARMAATDSMITRIDSAQRSARSVRLALHDSLFTLFRAIHDTGHVRQEADRIIALGHDHTPADPRVLASIEMAYRGLIEIAIGEHPDSVPSIVHRARRDLSSTVASDSARQYESDTFMPDFYDALQKVHDADETLYPDGFLVHSSGDTLRPVPGKVNVICNGGWPGISGEARDAQVIITQLRHWRARYGTVRYERGVHARQI